MIVELSKYGTSIRSDAFHYRRLLLGDWKAPTLLYIVHYSLFPLFSSPSLSCPNEQSNLKNLPATMAIDWLNSLCHAKYPCSRCMILFIYLSLIV